MKPFIILLNRCTQRCSYCFYSQKGTFGRDELPLQSLEQFLLNAGPSVDRDIVITGGEPLVYSNLTGLFEFLRSEGRTARLNSNLTRSETVDWQSVAPVLSRVDTTLDHFAANLHNELRGGYEQTMEGIRRVTEAKIPLGLTVVVSKKNYTEVSKIYDELSKLQPAYLFFQPIDVSNPAMVETHCLSQLDDMQMTKLCEDLRPWADKRGYSHMLQVMSDYYVGKKQPAGACGMMRDLFVIDCDGEVYPCFHRHDLPAGNILRDSANTIMDGVRTVKQRIEPQSCFSPKCIPLF